MTDDELFEKINKIEIRESKERTVKSYVLRNNVISPKAERILKSYMGEYGLFFDDGYLDYSKVFGNDNPVIIEIGNSITSASRYFYRVLSIFSAFWATSI